MKIQTTWLACLCAIAAPLGVHAAGHLDFAGQYSMTPPRYDSKDNVDRPAGATYGTPEDAARPGERFYFNAVRAFRNKDYAFTIDMYEVSASWGYKPAQYNLGVMYFKGEGVPVDRPRGMAWMALAAERDDPTYVQAREVVYAELSKEEFARANDLWRELKTTYGDAVALPRAKARWAQVRSEMTGSRVGGAGPLMIGAASGGGRVINIVSSMKDPSKPMAKTSAAPDNGGKSSVNGFATAAFGVLGGGGEDGSRAYRQLFESDNPYDPKFEWRNSPAATGTATVGPIRQASDRDADEQPRDH
jgi:hypothetical protein